MKTTSAQSFLFQALPLGILDLPTQAGGYWAVWEGEKLCDYECCCVHADHLPREQGP